MKRLYYNGAIITMEPFSAERKEAFAVSAAEALLTEKGRIRAVGSLEALRKLAAPEVEMIDLAGHALLPAFIDSHGHLAAAANTFLQCDLSEAESLAEMEKQLHDFAETLPEGAWLRAQGYDHNRLAEHKHPDGDWLEAICPDRPAVITHRSGHMGVFNRQALDRLGAEGKAGQNGYLEEEAFLQLQKKLPPPAMEDWRRAFEKAQNWYASQGIATAQEGMFPEQLVSVYQELLVRGELKLDVVAYAELAAGAGVKASLPRAWGQYDGRFKVGGYKIFLDGSPQGRTAWMRQPYAEKKEGEPDGYRGHGTMPMEAVEIAIKTAEEEGLQLLAHCNGDAACMQLMEAAERVQAEHTEKNNAGAAPPIVMIHAQFLPPDEVPRMVRLGMAASFFVGHVFYWGDVHVENMGLARAEAISPLQSAAREGLLFTLHQDAPVTPPNMLETVWCAVQRQTKQGWILGREERISVYEALQAVTVQAAAQYGELTEKGTLAEGKRADMVILDRNPLEAEPERLREIKVLATLKDGEVIYERGGQGAALG